MTLNEELSRTRAGRLALAEERLILDVTERICEEMQYQGVPRREVARKMKIKKSELDSLLDGRRLTVRIAAEMAFALGCTFKVSLERIER